MARYSKLLAVVNGVAALGTVYTAPSGTAIGSARGARILQIHFSNQDSSAQTFKVFIGGSLFGSGGTVIPTTSVSANGTKTYNLTIPLEAGCTLQVEQSGSGCVTYVSGEELTIG